MDMEENIKLLKKFNPGDEYTERIKQAIDHVLAERDEDQKYTIHLTDEQYRKVIENAQKDVEEKYKKKITELEEHQEKFYKGELYTAKQLKQLEENQKKYFINKQKVKEELEKAEKENEPYEEYNKESRAYWINQGRISLAKKLLEEK